jgi:hypothetical protein
MYSVAKNLPNNVELLSKSEKPNFASFDEGATTSQTASRDWLSLISKQRRTALKELKLNFILF